MCIRDRSWPLLRRVVLVVWRELARDSEMREQLPAMPRILGGDQIGACEHRERTQRNVAEIADRSRNEVEAWREQPIDKVAQHLMRARGDALMSLRRSAVLLSVLHAVLYRRKPRNC